jgi:hypothetical protein
MVTTGKLFQMCLLCAALLPAAVQAQFTFTTNNGAITITGYSGPGYAMVIIPGTTNGLPVTSIGNTAFQYRNVTSVTIPSSVTNIGNYAFYWCNYMTNVTIGTNVTSIGNNAFNNCLILTGVTIPNRVVSLGSYAFLWCNSMTNVTIGTNVASIGPQAFANCTKLTSVAIPGSLTNIGNRAFYGCTSLTAITVNTNNPAYASTAGVLFNKGKTTLIEYPKGGAGTYTISNSVTVIENNAFDGCASLTNLTIGTNVVSIGTNAFAGCTSLNNETIPNSVTSIAYQAFNGCSSLTNVAIGSSVTNIGNLIFFACDRLMAITVNTNNPAYSSLAGVWFNKSQTTLVEYPNGGAATYTIPGSVTHIGDYAFFFRSGPTNITIGTNVISIGSGAFDHCTGLTSVTIPNSVTSIGNDAFADCGNLANLTIGTSVTNIGDYAFGWCYSLNGIYFLGNAPAIGVSICYGCNPPIYYLPWTTGWAAFDANSGVDPAVLWLPQVQTGNASFGVQANQFGFNLTWVSDMVVVVEASTNLANAAWTPVGTNTLTGGSSYFSDPQWTNYPGRFYRLRWP